MGNIEDYMHSTWRSLVLLKAGRASKLDHAAQVSTQGWRIHHFFWHLHHPHLEGIFPYAQPKFPLLQLVTTASCLSLHCAPLKGV